MAGSGFNRLKKSLLLFVTLLGVTGVGTAYADTVHLANGQVVHGRIIDIVGEQIRFHIDVGDITTVNRLTMAGDRDEVETRAGQKITGEITYVDPFQLELMTSIGGRRIWRIFIKNVEIGLPSQPGSSLPPEF